jgi:hypothetical protein
MTDNEAERPWEATRQALAWIRSPVTPDGA